LVWLAPIGAASPADRLDLLDDWYHFRDEAAKAFVIAWAEFNEAPFEDDTARRKP